MLLNDVLKDRWGYQGWVMSDWGATDKWEYAIAGVDQESGIQIDALYWKSQPFVEPLKRGLLWGHAAEGAAFRHGAPHPAVDVCRRY